MQIGYTHSKYMQATEFLNSVDMIPYRTVSDMDRPNVFTITGLWEIPYGRGRHFGSHLPRKTLSATGSIIRTPFRTNELGSVPTNR